MESINQTSGENPNTTTDNMSFYWENALFSIGPITCLLAARYGPKAYAKWETLLTLSIGAGLAFKSEIILPIFLNSPVTDFHRFLCSAYACYFIATIAHPLLLSGSKDVSIFYGHYFGKIVSGTLIIIDNLSVYNEGVHWNYKYLCLVTSLAITNVAINTYFLAKTPKPSGQNPFIDFANSIGKLDFYILFVYGIYVYAFPDAFNLGLAETGESVLNESYRSLARTCGALVIGNSLESFCLSEFKFIGDKKRLLFARILAAIVEFAVFYSGHYCFKVYSFETMKTWLIINVVYNLIMMFGFIMTPREHKKAQ